jgi:hypothetical protein
MLWFHECALQHAESLGHIAASASDGAGLNVKRGQMLPDIMVNKL